MSEKSATSRYGWVAERRPDWAEAFRAWFGTTYQPPEPVLERRERVLVYLAALAAAGAVDSFRTHLADAAREGLSKAAVLEAVLLVAPAVGYSRVFDVVDALAADETLPEK